MKCPPRVVYWVTDSPTSDIILGTAGNFSKSDLAVGSKFPGACPCGLYLVPSSFLLSSFCLSWHKQPPLPYGLITMLSVLPKTPADLDLKPWNCEPKQFLPPWNCASQVLITMTQCLINTFGKSKGNTDKIFLQKDQFRCWWWSQSKGTWFFRTEYNEMWRVWLQGKLETEPWEECIPLSYLHHDCMLSPHHFLLYNGVIDNGGGCIIRGCSGRPFSSPIAKDNQTNKSISAVCWLST